MLLERAVHVRILHAHEQVQRRVIPHELGGRGALRFAAALARHELARLRRADPARIVREPVDHDRAARARDVHDARRRRRVRQIDVERRRDDRAVDDARPVRDGHPVERVVLARRDETHRQRRRRRLPVGPHRERLHVLDDLPRGPRRRTVHVLHVRRVEVHEVGALRGAAYERERLPGAADRCRHAPVVRDRDGATRRDPRRRERVPEIDHLAARERHVEAGDAGRNRAQQVLVRVPRGHLPTGGAGPAVDASGQAGTREPAAQRNYPREPLHADET